MRAIGFISAGSRPASSGRHTPSGPLPAGYGGNGGRRARSDARKSSATAAGRNDCTHDPSRLRLNPRGLAAAGGRARTHDGRIAHEDWPGYGGTRLVRFGLGLRANGLYRPDTTQAQFSVDDARSRLIAGGPNPDTGVATIKKVSFRRDFAANTAAGFLHVVA
jgi:hypothetical protein